MLDVRWKPAEWRCRAGALALCAWFGAGCQPKSSSEGAEDAVLATAGARTLYVQDIDVGPLLASKDSAEYVKKRAQDWVLEELILSYAEQDLALNTEKIEQQVRRYRKAITIHALEQQYLGDRLNRRVKEADIRSYYEKKREHFLLNEDILQLIYVKVPLSAPKLRAFRAFFRKKATDSAAMEDIRTYCKANLQACMLSRSTWVPEYKVLEAVPAKRRQFVQNRLKNRQYIKRHYIEVRDTSYVHLLRIFDYREAGTVPPLEHLRPNIKHDIVSRRKKALIKSLRTKIWSNAKQKNAFTIH